MGVQWTLTSSFPCDLVVTGARQLAPLYFDLDDIIFFTPMAATFWSSDKFFVFAKMEMRGHEARFEAERRGRPAALSDAGVELEGPPCVAGPAALLQAGLFLLAQPLALG